jgi:broad specificity phosphatase PhoE
MKLIIVRHGETPDNINDISQGQRETVLTEKGREQAIKLAERLKDEKIDFIYSSDLKRTKQTLQEILKFHDSPVVYSNLLRERANGHYEGNPRSAFIKEREESGIPKLEFKSPSGESVLDILERDKEQSQSK